ncbi:MAG: FAD-binding oxidoreductase [Chloroflexi bacterium]|nr:FAD-binding oxidoreductase [Chloroflexota bacterium]|tara:strand:- start:734 stop:2182 length:1449 start_codon:yes stop_codon:yes gene_type:complete
MVSESQIIQDLRSIVGIKNVIDEFEDLLVYEQDGSSDAALPNCVVLPESTEEVSAVMRYAKNNDIPIIARGAGTGLSGGAVTEHGGISLVLTRMNKIIEIDLENQIATVEPGVVNLELSQKVKENGLFYAPDPASQRACTLGGNIAENSGGPHCLAYGVTTNHVLGMEVVLSDGTINFVGSRSRDYIGYDLRGIIIGSEGTLAVVTKIIVKLMRIPEAVKTLLIMFDDETKATDVVSKIISTGIVPSALEMMDRTCVRAADEAFNLGYPQDIDAVLIIEVDGLIEEVDEDIGLIVNLCKLYDPLEILTAETENDRDKLWMARKSVIGALGRIAPNYLLMDGTVPRTKIGEAINKTRELSQNYGLTVANVFHAGDGNLHPCILFDARKEGDLEKALGIGGEILKESVKLGGVLTGEHGVGMEKREFMSLMFDEIDLDNMEKLQFAFGSFGNLNPGKIFPSNRKNEHPIYDHASFGTTDFGVIV